MEEGVPHPPLFFHFGPNGIKTLAEKSGSFCANMCVTNDDDNDDDDEREEERYGVAGIAIADNGLSSLRRVPQKKP